MAGFIDGEINASYDTNAPLYMGADGEIKSITDLGSAGDIYYSFGNSAPPQFKPPAYPSTGETWISFSPTIRGSTTAGSGTYSVQAGAYLLLNTTCYVKGVMVWTAHSGSAGDPAIGNLPYTIKNVSDNNHDFVAQSTSWSANDPHSAITSIGNDFAVLYSLNGGVSVFDSAATLWFSGFYEVA